MNILVLGAGGSQGRATAYDLNQNNRIEKLVLADIDGSELKNLAEWLNSQKCKWAAIDCSKKENVVDLIKKEEIDVLVCSVPWMITLPPLDAAIETGVDFVDYGLYQNIEFDKRIDEYYQEAKRAGITAVPSCGLAPGITNIVAASGASKLDQVDTIEVFVGGNPEKPEPPLYYKTVWSMEGVWTQFMEACRVIMDGKPTTVEATTGQQEIEFEEIGKFEAAYTDGLGTLLHAYKYPFLKGVKNVYEKTIRWPGHYDKIRTFKECGLLDTKPVEVQGSKIIPRDFLTALLDPVLAMKKDERDMVTLRVNTIGSKNGKTTTCTYEMIDYKDLETGLTSMSRTTGFTGAIIVDMIGQDKIKEKGVVLPEQIGADKEAFDELVAELEKRGITVKQK